MLKTPHRRGVDVGGGRSPHVPHTYSPHIRHHVKNFYLDFVKKAVGCVVPSACKDFLFLCEGGHLFEGLPLDLPNSFPCKAVFGREGIFGFLNSVEGE